jgi:hypothetical protein
MDPFLELVAGGNIFVAIFIENDLGRRQGKQTEIFLSCHLVDAEVRWILAPEYMRTGAIIIFGAEKIEGIAPLDDVRAFVRPPPAAELERGAQSGR